MKENALNSNIDPVRTKMTGTKNIPILHVCSEDDIKSKEFLVDINLSEVCSIDEGKLEIIIVDVSST